MILSSSERICSEGGVLRIIMTKQILRSAQNDREGNRFFALLRMTKKEAHFDWIGNKTFLFNIISYLIVYTSYLTYVAPPFSSHRITRL